MNKGLGRLFAPDERDKMFLIRDILPAAPATVQYKYWGANAWWGDQGETPKCVGYAWAHWIEDGPVNHDGVPPILPPDYIYSGAQDNDEFKGNDYDGTTVRGAAKFLQMNGYIKEYRWTNTVDEIAQTILSFSPVIVGTNFYNDMFEPDEKGLIKVGGELAGGHCYKLDGVSLTHGLFRIKNSWGRSWGHNGFAYISFEDMQRLISEDGEACIAIENDLIVAPI